MPVEFPRIKICCIANVEEARLAIAHGASALGLVSEMPSGPGVIGEEEIIEIAAMVPPGVASFLLTSRQNVDEIIEQQKRCGANTIQLVDHLVRGTYCDLKRALPGISIVQVIHVNGEDSIKEAWKASQEVDAILLDSGNQKLTVKLLGGTGRTHDWAISRAICETVNKPVFLAGGLNASNAVEAFQVVQPFGLDLCTGVRTDGKLDEQKLAAFFQQIRSI